ncbi:MAG: hypothetical protein Q7R81_02260 [Candidatus Peregrinibacteria bacterium]|nr:hypothetical protein [Candidatus Peregrinibacteria bacterium]
MTQTSPPPPLWKQLLGAVGGAALAYVLYLGYDMGAPMVTAYLQKEPETAAPVEQVAMDPVAQPVAVEPSVEEVKEDSRLKLQASIVTKTQEIAANYHDQFVTQAPPDKRLVEETIVAPKTTTAVSSAAAVVAQETSSSSTQKVVVAQAMPKLESPPSFSAAVSKGASSHSGSAKSAEKVAALHAAAPALPSSGIGTYFAGAVAFIGAYVFHARRKQRNA